MKVLYQPTLTCRTYQSDIEEVIYYGQTYYETFEEAEDDAYNARCHYKEKVVIVEHIQD